MTALSRGDRRELADRLHSAAIHLLRRVRRHDPLTGVSAAQLSALSVLMAGPRTLGELAAAEQVRPPTITRLVKDLDAARLVARSGDTADRRVSRVRLTAKGRRLLGEGRARRIAEIEGLLDGLSRPERDALARALRGLERTLGGRH